MVDAPIYMQRLCGYTKTGGAQRAFCDFQHPKDSLALASTSGFEGRHCIDWASPNPWATRPWAGHTGVNKAIMDAHLQDQPWRWGNGPREEDEEVTAEMFYPCVQEPDDRWDDFQQKLLSWTGSLPPPPVRIDWDPEDAELPERLVAALYRDGCVVLGGAVGAESCDQVVADMGPYLDAAAERDGTGAEARAGALLARSEASWGMVQHPAVMRAVEAVIGRQVLDMSKDEMQKNMRYPGRSVPWAISAAWLSRALGGSTIDSELGRAASFLELNLGRFQRPRVKRPLEYSLSTVWAVENGVASRFVPASHRWPQHRAPLESEAVTASLSVGDVAIATGHVCQASSAPTDLLNIDFAAGFVAEQEVQVLSNPPAIARHYPKSLQRLCGYETHGDAVSYYQDWQHPINSFDLTPVNWAEVEGVAARL